MVLSGRVDTRSAHQPLLLRVHQTKERLTTGMFITDKSGTGTERVQQRDDDLDRYNVFPGNREESLLFSLTLIGLHRL